MASTRSTFSPANIQQRPLCFWFVISGVLMTCEKVRCAARTTASRLRATTCTLPAVTAFSARRLRGSAAKALVEARDRPRPSAGAAGPTIAVAGARGAGRAWPAPFAAVFAAGLRRSPCAPSSPSRTCARRPPRRACPLPRLPLPFALSRVVARDFVRAAVSLLTCRLLGWMTKTLSQVVRRGRPRQTARWRGRAGNGRRPRPAV